MNTPSTCPHFSLCSGCAISGDPFLPPIKERIATYFQEKQAPIAFHSDGFLHSRWKAKLAIRGGASDPQIGLFKRHSHDVVSIPQCLVHHPAINQASQLLKQAIQKHQISPFNENRLTGLLRYAQFFVERTTGRVQLALSVNAAEISPDLDTLCNTLATAPLFHSIWINLNPGSTNRIFSDTWVHHSGEPWLWQFFPPTNVAFHPGAFSQAHLPLFEQILHSIDRTIPPHSTCLELFAGTGAISLFLAPKCRHIDLIENNPFSALSFQTSLQNADPSRLAYHLADAHIPPKHYDAIIVDPPRKGVDAPLLNELNRHPAKSLIYMSCHFDSFQRDCDALLQGGWKLERAEGYFLFPGTNEVELLAFFRT